ncbi:HNH endonuclease signature motif containing protein [Nesterenkonia sp. K-15-9-6]|uniref:HNH endonuclease signature motif containing protein n=1 Tax=Nesterenkonia sp. K-15-9-6 TaxID=3093918 RepID=UPI004043CDC5
MEDQDGANHHPDQHSQHSQHSDDGAAADAGAVFWPARAAHLAQEPELSEARALIITTRQTEAQALTNLLDYQDRRAREAHTAGLDHHTRRAIFDAATGDAATTLGVSEQVASGMLTAARTARRQLPATWKAYTAGVIDTARLRAITTTATTLIQAAHCEDFDTAAAAAATRMTLGELRAWLRRYTATLDPAQYEKDCQTARADRWVRLQHDDHAMSYLEARLPTVAATAIANRLRAVARGHQHHRIPAPADTHTHTDTHCTTGSCTTGSCTTGRDSPTGGESSQATSAQPVLPVEHPELPPITDQTGPAAGPITSDLVPVQVQDGPEVLPGETPAPGDSDRLETPTAPTADTADTADTAESRDCRTLAQLEADLFAAWLLDGRVEGAPVEAKIAVMIPETTLTGHSDAPGISADRNWVIPASDARHLAGDPRTCHDWYHATTPATTSPTQPSPIQPSPIQPSAEDASPDILSITYTGRYAPARLRDAIIFRDGVCQAPGCIIPAQRCDLDHRLPYPAGPTSGTNLQALCRRHHRIKSHGLLSTEDQPTPPKPTASQNPPASPPPPTAPPPTTSSPPRTRRSQHRPPPLTRLSWNTLRAMSRGPDPHRRTAPHALFKLLHAEERTRDRDHP